MLTIGISMDSTMKFMVNRRSPAAIRRASIASMHIAVSEYLTNKLPAGGPRGIRERFGALAFTVYGFTPRSSSYESSQRQDQKLRGAHAYISPRFLSARDRAMLARGSAMVAGSAISSGIAAGQLSAMAALLAKVARFSRPHMRDAITRAGTGHQVLINRGASQIAVKLPAANILNRSKKTHDYGVEFRDLSRGGGRDIKAIFARASALYDLQIAREMAA